MNLRVLLLLAVLTTTWSTSVAAAWSGTQRYAVVIGNDGGQGSDVPLRFAERDADKIATTLQRVGGFEPADVVVVRGAGTDTVRRSLIAMNDRIRQAGTSTQSLLFVFYSGHADADALHLGTDRFALNELEALVRGSSAGFRVLVLDACRSGGVTNVKGARPAPLFALPSSSSSSSSSSGPGAEGYVVLTAAAAGEDAQESELLRGSFFTHHLVSGLLGAADDDHDDLVTLDEAYGHAFHETVRASSATLAGTQHPTFRYDVRGKGDIVLASLAAARRREATIALPDDVDVLLFADDGRNNGNGNGDVVAEIKATAGARRVLVTPGRYFVRARAPDVLYEGSVDVVAGEQKRVALSALTRTEYARLVRKGEGERVVVVAPRVGVMLHTPWLEGGGGCVGGLVAVPVELRWLSITPRLGVCGASWQNAFLKAHEVETSVDVAVSHVFDLPFVSLSLGAFGGGMLLSQRFVTTGIAPSTSTTAPVFGVTGGAVVPLVLGLYAHVGAEARSTVLQLATAHGPTTTTTITTPVALGVNAGIGWTL